MDNSFNSIDRLVEFGMSIAVAQQMIHTMNHCISNMMVPGASTVQHSATKHEYYLVINNNLAGPYQLEDLNGLVSNGQLKNDTLVWHTGLTGWTFARNVSEINKILTLNK